MKRNLYSNMRRMTTTFCIMIAGITLVLLALRLTVFSDMAGSVEQPKTTSSSQASEEPEAEEDGLFAYEINRKIYVARPDAKGDILIRNPESNDYYMSVDILLIDSKDSVLFTGFIMPGESRDSARLDRSLGNGVYECVAEISAYDPQSLDKIGSLLQEVTIYIGEKP